jgi:hypothetical protein
MKRILLILLGLFSAQAQAYDIWIKNSTNKGLRVKIDDLNGCKTFNHGNESDADPLAPGHQDSWPAKGNCSLSVTVYAPTSGQQASFTAHEHYRSLEVIEVSDKGKMVLGLFKYGKN